MGRYTMPKPTATERVARDARRRRRGPIVRGPEDLVFADQVPTANGSDAREVARVRERAAQLEGALAAATDLERRATAELERAREDRREDLERARLELAAERERHATELAAVRGTLEQRERELRTLVLEMGKTQGRLETTERRLLETAGSGPARPATVAGRVRERWQTWVAIALFAVIGIYGARFLIDVARYEVQAAERGAAPRDDGAPSAGARTGR